MASYSYRRMAGTRPLRSVGAGDASRGGVTATTCRKRPRIVRSAGSPREVLEFMESDLLHDIITEGFDAVAEFLGFKSDLLATVRERIEAGVTGKGPIDPEDALVLRWLALEWGERLTLLRHHDEPGFNAANEPVTRLVALVKLALVVRGADEAQTMERRPSPLHQPYTETRREENPPPPS